jgi:hypothetical protein
LPPDLSLEQTQVHGKRLLNLKLPEFIGIIEGVREFDINACESRPCDK